MTVVGGKHSGGDGPKLWSPDSKIKDDSNLKEESDCEDVPERDCHSDSFNTCITYEIRVRKLHEPYHYWA